MAAEPDGPEVSDAVSVAVSALNKVVARVVVLTPFVNETDVVKLGALPPGAVAAPDQAIVCVPL